MENILGDRGRNSKKMQNKSFRALKEIAFDGGRSSKSRQEWIERNEARENDRVHLSSRIGLPDFNSLPRKVVLKRESAAKKLVLARKIRASFIFRSFSSIRKFLVRRAGWESKPKEHYLKLLSKKQK